MATQNTIRLSSDFAGHFKKRFSIDSHYPVKSPISVYIKYVIKDRMGPHYFTDYINIPVNGTHGELIVDFDETADEVDYRDYNMETFSDANYTYVLV